MEFNCTAEVLYTCIREVLMLKIVSLHQIKEKVALLKLLILLMTLTEMELV